MRAARGDTRAGCAGKWCGVRGCDAGRRGWGGLVSTSRVRRVVGLGVRRAHGPRSACRGLLDPGSQRRSTSTKGARAWSLEGRRRAHAAGCRRAQPAGWMAGPPPGCWRRRRLIEGLVNSSLSAIQKSMCAVRRRLRIGDGGWEVCLRTRPIVGCWRTGGRRRGPRCGARGLGRRKRRTGAPAGGYQRGRTGEFEESAADRPRQEPRQEGSQPGSTRSIRDAKGAGVAGSEQFRGY